MPEHAEIRITKDYINQISPEILFHKISYSKEAKGIKKPLPFEKFHITAQSRGKELKLILRPIDGKPYIKLVFQFGMTGNWYFVNYENFKKIKHVHIWFEGKKEDKSFFLAFQDVRRFGSWRLSHWGENRGPDPIDDSEAFIKNIKDNLHKKVFEGRILEVLMNQKYFNGIGNYLRAEIIAQANINPFLPAKDVLSGQSGIEFLKTINKVIKQAHYLGGAQLKDWKNPFGKNKEEFMEWLQVYGKSESMLDKQKRNFWYLKKWKK